jgi:HK97 family phage prohead protease
MEDRKFRRTAEREKNKFMQFEMKDLNDSTGEVAFYFAAWGLDRDGDIMKKSAYPKTIKENFKNIYHNFDHMDVCGVVKSLDVDERGAFCVSKMLLNTDVGRNTYEMYKAGAIKGHSQEFETLEYAYENIANNKKARVISDVRLWGVTTCSKIPANADTPTISVKSLTDAIEYMQSLNDLLTKGHITDLAGEKFQAEYLKLKAFVETGIETKKEEEPKPLITKSMVEKFSLK